METVYILLGLVIVVMAAVFAVMGNEVKKLNKKVTDARYDSFEHTNKQTTEIAISVATIRNRLDNLEEAIPKGLREQWVKYDSNMNRINEELERHAAAEKTWNDSIASILNYSVNPNK